MALDVFVMPLLRFKLDDFTTATERLFGRDKVTTLGPVGTVVKRPRGFSTLRTWFAERNARREIKLIKQAVSHANPGIMPEWRDEGEVVYSEQGHFVTVQTFAKWLDCLTELPDFTPPPDNNYYNHPAWKFTDRPLTFRHLVEHSCHSGYLLPVRFENLTTCEPFKIRSWNFAKSIGSSQTLLSQLERLAEVTSRLAGSPAREFVESELGQLTKICQLSVQHRLPVIFHG